MPALSLSKGISPWTVGESQINRAGQQAAYAACFTNGASYPSFRGAICLALKYLQYTTPVVTVARVIPAITQSFENSVCSLSVAMVAYWG